jgi:hypothetical protein
MSVFRFSRWIVFSAALALVAVTIARATSIRPPNFDQLVENSGRIVHATVEQVRPYEDSYEGKRIVRTEVTLQVVESLDGNVSAGRLVIRHLGGSVNDLRLEVGAMPEYTPGQEVVLFLHGEGRYICPTVGWGHGKYFVDRSSVDGVARVRRSDGSSLQNLQQVAEPIHDEGHHAQHEEDHSSVDGMTLAQFRLNVREQLACKENQK